MRFHRTVAIAAVALPLFVIQSQAAELKVFATMSVKSLVEELGPQFEKSTENKLNFTIGGSADLKAQIDQGAAFDVAILTVPLINALADAGKIDGATRAIVARAGLGVSVRAGAAKPDVSTEDALKRTLLNAMSVGFNGQGASRSMNEAMMSKLGIADEMKPKIKLLDIPAPEGVAKGQVEIGLGPISEILTVPGAQVAGPFPAGLQSYLVVSGGVAAHTKDAGAAQALIKFLTSPAVLPALKARGMEPG
jgi:molybdate transport system substrate-binding protein